MLRRFTAPLGTAASAAACFVLMVNIFPTFALACSNVPVIRELAAAAAFSPSLSAAVAHDYVQYIGQSQTVDGVTVDLGYAIVDQHQMVFVYSVDGGRFYTSPELLDENGDHIAAAYSTSTVKGDMSGQSNGLESMILSFSGPRDLPAGVELVDVRPVGTGVELTILSPKLREQFAQSFSHTYWDPEGGEHEWHQMSTIRVDAEDSDSGEAKHKEVFYLDNYSWDAVELELSYTSVAEYVEPVRVPLAAK